MCLTITPLTSTKHVSKLDVVAVVVVVAAPAAGLVLSRVLVLVLHFVLAVVLDSCS